MRELKIFLGSLYKIKHEALKDFKQYCNHQINAINNSEIKCTNTKSKCQTYLLFH